MRALSPHTTIVAVIIVCFCSETSSQLCACQFVRVGTHLSGPFDTAARLQMALARAAAARARRAAPRARTARARARAATSFALPVCRPFIFLHWHAWVCVRKAEVLQSPSVLWVAACLISVGAAAGTCKTVPGPCDAENKGCCYNGEAGVNYCSPDGDERLSCDVAPVGDENGLRCAKCGHEGESCCMGSGADAKLATPAALATSAPLCASADLGCMLDQGHPSAFAKCAFQPPVRRLASQRGPSVHTATHFERSEPPAVQMRRVRSGAGPAVLLAATQRRGERAP